MHRQPSAQSSARPKQPRHRSTSCNAPSTRSSNASSSRPRRPTSPPAPTSSRPRAALEAEKADAYKLRDRPRRVHARQRDFESNRTLYEGLLAAHPHRRCPGRPGVTGNRHRRRRHPAASPHAADPFLHPHRSTAPLSLVVGIILAFVLESLDTGLRSVAEIETVTGLASLALIPRARRAGAEPAALTPVQRNIAVLANPKSQFAESFRALRTSLLLSTAGRPPQIILLTSATPSEGKTTISTNLACVLAQRDVRVLLIDADLRRPTVHHRFGLNGTHRPHHRPHRQHHASKKPSSTSPTFPISTSWPAAPCLRSPPKCSAPDAWTICCKVSESIYTHIVIDSPPLLSVTDGVVLARDADAVVLIVRHGKVLQARRPPRPRPPAPRRRPLTGIVLNAVDLNSPEYYGYYGYSGYSLRRRRHQQLGVAVQGHARADRSGKKGDRFMSLSCSHSATLLCAARHSLCPSPAAAAQFNGPAFRPHSSVNRPTHPHHRPALPLPGQPRSRPRRAATSSPSASSAPATTPPPSASAPTAKSSFRSSASSRSQGLTVTARRSPHRAEAHRRRHVPRPPGHHPTRRRPQRQRLAHRRNARRRPHRRPAPPARRARRRRRPPSHRQPRHHHQPPRPPAAHRRRPRHRPARSALANIPIFGGDTIIIARVGVVYVLGAFKTQGAIPLTGNSPAHAPAGHRPLRRPSFRRQLRRPAHHPHRRQPTHPGQSRHPEVMYGKDPDPVLQADDIIFLPDSTLKAPSRTVA